MCSAANVTSNAITPHRPTKYQDWFVHLICLENAHVLVLKLLCHFNLVSRKITNTSIRHVRGAVLLHSLNTRLLQSSEMSKATRVPEVDTSWKELYK
jgi:hypothetical protein